MTRPSTRAERVSKTALLAGAALAFPLSAKAGTVFYSGIQDITVISPSTNDPYSLSLDGSASDFTFDALSSTDTVAPLMVGINQNAYVSNGTNDPDPLIYGATIGPSQTYSTGTGTLQDTEPFEGTGPPTQKGPWPKDPNSVAYLGVQFYIGTDLTYGWVGLSACTPALDGDCANSTIVIQDWGYDTSGAAVTAGEGEAPEPSTLALFALGAVGLAVLRARKRAA